MRASVGDRIIVKGLHLGEPDRDGEILAVRRPDGRPALPGALGGRRPRQPVLPCVDAIVEHHGRIDRTVVR
jgi:hypothetical protein